MKLLPILFVLCLGASAAIAAGAAMADSPILVDPETGEYLGNTNPDPYDPDSIHNPYGEYGSPYSPKSINNPYGEYGNPYSPKHGATTPSQDDPLGIDPY